LSTDILCRIVWKKFTGLSDVLTASIIREIALISEAVSNLKPLSIYTRLRCKISQKTSHQNINGIFQTHVKREKNKKCVEKFDGEACFKGPLGL
jgi:hypothetical protein